MIFIDIAYRLTAKNINSLYYNDTVFNFIFKLYKYCMPFFPFLILYLSKERIKILLKISNDSFLEVLNFCVGLRISKTVSLHVSCFTYVFTLIIYPHCYMFEFIRLLVNAKDL